MGNTFRDNLGRTHTVNIDAEAIRLMRVELGIDLAAMSQDEVCNQFARSGVQLINALWYSCRPACNMIDFCWALEGKGLVRAGEAMRLALAEFYGATAASPG